MLVAKWQEPFYVRPMPSSRRFSAAAVGVVVAIAGLTATSVAPAAGGSGVEASSGDGAAAAKKRCKRGYTRKTVKRGRRKVSVCVRKRKRKAVSVDGRYEGLRKQVNAVISGNGTTATISVNFFEPGTSSCPPRTVTYPAVRVGQSFDTAKTATSPYGKEGIVGSVRRTAGGGFAYTITAVLGGLDGIRGSGCNNYVRDSETDFFSKVR